MAVTEFEPQKLTLSSLWTDTRYRSITMQILVLAGLFATVFFLVSNAIDNLAALDKEVGFGFLSQPASYDINQALNRSVKLNRRQICQIPALMKCQSNGSDPVSINRGKP